MYNSLGGNCTALYGAMVQLVICQMCKEKSSNLLVQKMRRQSTFRIKITRVHNFPSFPDATPSNV
jgi:hypothetical protein